MTARFYCNQRNTRGHGPRLQHARRCAEPCCNRPLDERRKQIIAAKRQTGPSLSLVKLCDFAITPGWEFGHPGVPLDGFDIHWLNGIESSEFLNQSRRGN